jgi:hypothetical protein
MHNLSAKITLLRLSKKVIFFLVTAEGSEFNIKFRNFVLKLILLSSTRCSCLKSLLLDVAHITYPSSELASQGTEAVIRFFCNGKRLSIRHSF